MINGFEEETAPLTEAEHKMVPWFVAGLSTKIGADMAITSDEMAKAILDKKGVTVTGARIRKIINYIRVTHQVPRLMATSKGYYITNDRAELGRYIQSLKQREEAIRAMRTALEKQASL